MCVCVCVGIEIDFGTSKDERERDMNEVPEHRVQFRVETVAQKATPNKAKFDESLPVEMIFSTGNGKESLVDRFVVGGGGNGPFLLLFTVTRARARALFVQSYCNCDL